MTAPVTLRRVLFRAVPLAATASLFALPALAGGYGGYGGCAGGDCYRYVKRPPSYATVGEPVMVRPPHTVYTRVPPAFETVAEKVLVAPARRVWQVTHGPHGEPIGCWVTVPPRYAVQHRQVMVRPPQAIPHAVPAVYSTRYRTVMTDPGYAGWKPVGGHGGGYARIGYGGHGYSGYGPSYGGPVGAAAGFAGGLATGAIGAAAGIAGGVTGGVLGLDYGY